MRPIKAYENRDDFPLIFGILLFLLSRNLVGRKLGAGSGCIPKFIVK